MKSEQASTSQGQPTFRAIILKVGMGVFALEKVVIPIVKINIFQLPSPII